MKKLRFLWSLMALPLLAASCSDKDVLTSDSKELNTTGQDGVYMTINITPAGRNGTRSQTNGNNSSNSGTEVGTDVENTVNDALVVITDDKDEFIVYSQVPFTEPNGSSKGSIKKLDIPGNPLYETTARFDKTSLGQYYEEKKNDPNVGLVHVYVFCNPTSDLREKMKDVAEGQYSDGNWYDMVYPYSSSDVIWSSTRGFTMSNVSPATRQLPANIDEWTKYSTESSAFKLSGLNSPGTEGAVDNLNGGRGAIQVHRMAARFDFRDGSQIEGLGNGVPGSPFTYAVVNNTAGDNLVQCKFYAMGLTNMSKTQYYLGRTTNDLVTNPSLSYTTTLCGDETATNSVVSTYWSEKYDYIDANFGTYFEHPFFSNEGLVQDKGYGWAWDYCDEIVQGTSDNYVSSGENPTYNKSFHVWRYVTENTLPGANRQVNGQSTGVIFKARMLPATKLNQSTDKWEKELALALSYDEENVGSGKLLNKNADTDPILYSLAGNTLYVTWQNVQEAALNAAGFDKTKDASAQNLDRKAPLYITCFGTGGYGTVTIDDKTYTDDIAQDPTSANYLWQLWDDARKSPLGPQGESAQAAKTDFKKKATGVGFVLYQSSEDPQTKDWGYYCYYYYWNRHNDNLNNGSMGRMEFAVVRNNVYKLTVTKLNTLGHPRIPENDPDDPKPETPDESSEVYMTVNVEVVPWVVRINDIEF